MEFWRAHGGDRNGLLSSLREGDVSSEEWTAHVRRLITASGRDRTIYFLEHLQRAAEVRRIQGLGGEASEWEVDIAMPSLCYRCAAITVPSLCHRCAIAVPSLCHHCATNAPSLHHCTITAGGASGECTLRQTEGEMDSDGAVMVQ